MQISPNLEYLITWLTELNIQFTQCDTCQALHISHICAINNVYDAKIELIDDILYYTIMTEVRPSAIPTLISELSQINAASPIIKVFMDIPDDDYPRLILSHNLSCGEGISISQFALFMLQVEEEALQIVSEVRQCDLLVNPSENTKAKKIASPQTFH